MPTFGLIHAVEVLLAGGAGALAGAAAALVCPMNVARKVAYRV